MNLKYATAAAALAVAVLGIAAPVRAQNAEGVAAIVNDHVISTYDVRQRAAMLLLFANIPTSPEMLQRASSQALRDLVDERLQIEEASKFDISIGVDQVDRRIGDMASRNQMTLEGLAGNLSANGISLSTLRQQVEAEIAWQRLISGLYGSRVRVSETEITETQQRIAASAQRPQYEISEIFLPADTPQDFAEMEQGAAHLLDQMQQQRAPFPLVARQFSRAPSAAAGGDLGWITAAELAPEVRPIAERLQPGQVSLPIRASNGVYIIAMRDRREGVPEGATSIVTLRQISAPAARSGALERVRRRIEGCGNLDSLISGVQGATAIDLGQTVEAELSPAIRARLTDLEPGAASAVQVEGEQASMVVLCARETGGRGVPGRDEISDQLRETELTMLADRYLRNLRREATIITRQ
ncbi:MAG: peptidylprolyl isomerase [Hyphomonadaceae bacterium]